MRMNAHLLFSRTVRHLAVFAAAVCAAAVPCLPGMILRASAAEYDSGTLVNDKGTIYVVTEPGVLVGFSSMGAFNGLGYSLKNTVNGSIEGYRVTDRYVLSAPDQAHPWTAWVNDKGTIYYSHSSGLIGVPSAATFLANGGRFDRVVPMTEGDRRILQGAPRLPLLIPGDPRVVVRGPKLPQGPVESPDRVPPSVVLISPNDGTDVSGRMAVFAQASDNVGVQRVELRIDGRIVGPFAYDQTAYRYDIAAGTVVKGEHLLSAVAYDAAGNKAESAQVKVMFLEGIEEGPIDPPPLAFTTVSLEGPSVVNVLDRSRYDLTIRSSTGTAVDYAISWGDGTTQNGKAKVGSGIRLTHLYGAAGTYVIRVAAGQKTSTPTTTEKTVTVGRQQNGTEISVTEYGAKGDGKTDDTSAVQAAVNGAAGQTVIFPSGTYLVAGVSVPGGTALSGSNATLLFKALPQASMGVPMFNVTGPNVSFRGLNFNGNRSGHIGLVGTMGYADAYDTAYGYGGRAFRSVIKADGAARTIHHLTVEGCSFEETYGAAVAARDVPYVAVRNSSSKNSNYELAFLYSTIGSAALKEGATITDNTVINIDNGQRPAPGADTASITNGNGFVINNYDSIVFTGNTGRNIARALLKVEGGSNAVIKNNKLEGNILGYAGLQLIAYRIRNVTVSDNQFINTGNGIKVTYTSQSDVENFTVTRNVVDGSYAYNGFSDVADGISIDAVPVKNVVISDNIVRNVKRVGIISSASGDIAITGNTVKGTNDAHNSGIVLMPFAPITAAVVTNNSLSQYGGNFEGVMVFYGSPAKTYGSLTVTGNTVNAGSSSRNAIRGTGDGIAGYSNYILSGTVSNNAVTGIIELYHQGISVENNT